MGGVVRPSSGAERGTVLAALSDADLIYVSTRRRSGEWSDQAPIWFCLDEGTIYFTTSPGSWKARRLREAGPLRINVGSADGPEIVAEAERLRDLAVVDRMGRTYEKKYWIAWLGFFKPRADRVSDGRTVAYRVELPG